MSTSAITRRLRFGAHPCAPCGEENEDVVAPSGDVHLQVTQEYEP
jgi:hypothetical protein